METNSLQHHGVKGQHWGVRRTPEQLGHRIAQKRAKDKISSIKKKEKEKIKIMRAQAKSDSRIEKERVRLEKKYGTSKKTNESSESETQTQNTQHTSANAPKPKTSGWYSSEEGRRATAEMRAKYEYLDYQKRLSDMQPKKVSNGKRLAKFLGSKMIVPAVESVGRQGVEYLLGTKVNELAKDKVWEKKKK